MSWGSVWMMLTVGLTAPASPEPAAQRTTPRSAVERMLDSGVEEEQLKRRVGVWDVAITFRSTPDAAPVVTTGVMAERAMVGLYLEEIMKPAPGSKAADFRRISYLYYSKVEGRWQYVSLDTRLPVGIMPAWSFGKGTSGTLTLHFESLAFVGLGDDVEGRMIRSNFEITRESDDHEFGRQYWIQADGTGRQWLAVQYEYQRRR
jgi:hypothetical protein